MMDPGPTQISVAMATYNGARYLQAQLESLAAQTLCPAELVICDDGSTDGTLDLLHEFSQSAPFPVHLHRNHRRLGYGENFLKAASLTSGRLIAFCDQDDIWLTNKLKVCAREFADAEVLLCAHSGLLLQGNVRSTSRMPAYNQRRVYAPATLYPLQGTLGMAMVIRRDLLTTLNSSERWPAMQPHDSWLWLLAVTFGKVALLPDTLVLYRQHSGNLFGYQNERDALKKRLRYRDYLSRAFEEETSAAHLLALAETVSPDRTPALLVVVAYLRHCATLNHLRERIYVAGFAERLRSLLLMLVRGGYTGRPVRSGGLARPPVLARWKSPLKDFAIGVLRLCRTEEIKST